jgi:hypothetical protein
MWSDELVAGLRLLTKAAVTPVFELSRGGRFLDEFRRRTPIPSTM